MQKVVNIAVIGAGNWGKKVLEEYLQLMKSDSRVNLSMVADLGVENLQYCKTILGISKNNLTRDYKKILHSEEISAVHICTPIETHYSLCKEVLNSGKHVLLEKPMAMRISEALELKEGDNVLEVGAGSGYQAALISELVGQKGQVITTEIVPELVEFATNNIKKCKINNVKVIIHDGSQGYKKQAPYDKIIITAACPKIPKPLIGQIEVGGLLIMPVGKKHSYQELILLKRTEKEITRKNLGGVAFVPLIGKFAFDD